MSSPCVIDACVAAKWWLDDEQYIAEAAHILKSIRGGGIEPAVPGLWFYELANVIIQAHRKKRLTKHQAEEFIFEIQAMPVLVFPVHENLARMADLATQYSISAYDAAYLALAESLGCNFLTADDSLFNSIGGKCHFVHHLREAQDLFGV